MSSPAMPASGRIDWLGAALVLIAAIAFSAKAIFVKLAYADAYSIDAVTLLTLRMLYALPLFLLIAWWSARGQPALSKREWVGVISMGVLGYYLASLLDFMGLQYISAAFERLVLFLYPTFVVLLGVGFTGYRIVRRDVFALVVSYAGILLVFFNDLSLNAPGVVWGTALVLLSSLCYAGYLVGAGQLVTRIGAVRFGAYASLSSTLAIVLHFLVTRPLHLLLPPAPVMSLVAAMAVFSTVLPVILMAEGLRRIGSSNASMLGAIGPVATIFLGYAFLNEPITLVQLAGAALVLAGVLAISLKRKAVAVTTGTN